MSFWQFGMGTAASLWLIIWFLPWQPWRNREFLDASVPVPPKAIDLTDLSDLTVVMPARNEAAVITTTLQAIIDDCALVGRVKSEGYKTWMGLTHSVSCQRTSQSFADIWDMVARTAFTQLRYSISLLLLCTAVMLLMYWLPVLGLFVFEWPWVQGFAWFACASMAFCYWPTLKFYHRHPLWCLTMPLIAGFYLAMVWSSAIRYWNGEKTRWKGRVYDA